MDDLGADVIKIEPSGGSAARSMNGRDRRRPMSVGWLCGQVLDDLGADVIKIEPPDGSAARSMNGCDRRRPRSSRQP